MDIRSNDSVYIGMGCGTPTFLIKEMLKQDVENVTVYHLLTLGNLSYLNDDRFKHISLFTSGNSRDYVNKTGNYVPTSFFGVTQMIKRQEIPVDVVLLQVSPPNKEGFCSYGLTCDCLPEACKQARTVIAHINPQIPFVRGHKIHVNDFDEVIELDYPLNLYENQFNFSDEENQAACHAATLIEDDSSVQVGVGTLPALVLGHVAAQRLKIFTEAAFKPIQNLIEKKQVEKVTCTMILGDQEFIDFVGRKSFFKIAPASHTNSPSNILIHSNFVSLNSVMAIDLYGQASADYSRSDCIYSGIGGLTDFARIAPLTKNGKSIIVMTSRTKKGVSKICNKFETPVVLARHDIQYVATEYGVVNLTGLTVASRALALISIAHPEDRDQLKEDAYNMGILSN